MENEHTEAFLQGLGVPPETAYELRNADSEGRSIGFVLSELLAYTGANQEAFLHSLVNLTPEQAKQLAEACHGVDPNGEGEFNETDDYAEYAGLQRDELEEMGISFTRNNNEPFVSYSTYNRPHSILGLQNFIKRTGIALTI